MTGDAGVQGRQDAPETKVGVVLVAAQHLHDAIFYSPDAEKIILDLLPDNVVQAYGELQTALRQLREP